MRRKRRKTRNVGISRERSVDAKTHYRIAIHKQVVSVGQGRAHRGQVATPSRTRDLRQLGCSPNSPRRKWITSSRRCRNGIRPTRALLVPVRQFSPQPRQGCSGAMPGTLLSWSPSPRYRTNRLDTLASVHRASFQALPCPLKSLWTNSCRRLALSGAPVCPQRLEATRNKSLHNRLQLKIIAA